MRTPLFRSQVTQAKQASWLGGIHLAHNPRFSIVAGVALALAGALLAFGAWGKVARKVRVAGILMAQWGTLELSAPTAGILLSQSVQEGDWVQQGQTLFVINTDKATPEGSAATLLASHLTQRRTTLQSERTSRQAQHTQRLLHLTERIRSLSLESEQAAQEQALAKPSWAIRSKHGGALSKWPTKVSSPTFRLRPNKKNSSTCNPVWKIANAMAQHSRASTAQRKPS